jgi:hypothetical protein
LQFAIHIKLLLLAPSQHIFLLQEHFAKACGYGSEFGEKNGEKFKRRREIYANLYGKSAT